MLIPSLRSARSLGSVTCVFNGQRWKAANGDSLGFPMLAAPEYAKRSDAATGNSQLQSRDFCVMKGDALPRNGKRKALESVLVEANAKLLWHGDSPGLRTP